MQPEAVADPEMPSWHDDGDSEDLGLGPVEESFLLDSFEMESDEEDTITPMKGMTPKCSKRRLRKLLQDNRLHDFLQRHGFDHLSHSQRCGGDDFNPIHLAAQEGDHQVLRALLRIGVNWQQKTSLGQTALEIAKRCNCKGSHDLVIEMLRKTQVFQSRQVFLLGI